MFLPKSRPAPKPPRTTEFPDHASIPEGCHLAHRRAGKLCLRPRLRSRCRGYAQRSSARGPRADPVARPPTHPPFGPGGERSRVPSPHQQPEKAECGNRQPRSNQPAPQAAAPSFPVPSSKGIRAPRIGTRGRGRCRRRAFTGIRRWNLGIQLGSIPPLPARPPLVMNVTVDSLWSGGGIPLRLGEGGQKHSGRIGSKTLWSSLRLRTRPSSRDGRRRRTKRILPNLALEGFTESQFVKLGLAELFAANFRPLLLQQCRRRS